MPSRYLTPEAPQSGLDAFLTGAAQAYTGVKDERRKRQVESQQDALLRQQMENAQAEQQRRDIEGGYTRVDLAPIAEATDQIRQATSQASGVRAKIGAILSRAMGGESPALGPTSTLVKTGPSQQETLTRMGEEGLNARNAAGIASARDLAGVRESGDDRRSTASLAEQRYEADLNHGDRLAAIAAQRNRDSRTEGREDARDLRDYGRQLNEEIVSLQRMAADRNGIMQQVGGAGDPVAAYQEKQREIRTRIGELHSRLNEVNGAMSRRSIGGKLAAPSKKAPVAGVPPRTPTLQEDLQAAMRP